MAWLAKTFTALDSAPLWSDLNHLHDDTVTWGGNVDGGGHTLTNAYMQRVLVNLGTRQAFTGGETQIWGQSGFGAHLESYQWAVDVGISAAVRAITVTALGYVGIGKISPGSKLAISGLPSYANDAAALAGGLTSGDLYQVSSTNPRQIAQVI